MQRCACERCAWRCQLACMETMQWQQEQQHQEQQGQEQTAEAVMLLRHPQVEHHCAAAETTGCITGRARR
jgi:hypothetical protein